MDSFEINKLVGGALACLLLITAVRLAAEAIYAPHLPPGGEAAVPAAPPTAAVRDDTPPLAILLARADLDRGQKAARKCVSCHTFTPGGKNRIGPNLWSILGQKVAAVSGFAYSTAMQNHPGEWGYEELFTFLEKPRRIVPGTKMSFAGIRKAQARADLILYLRSLSERPRALPAP